jgi:hypothetical protein
MSNINDGDILIEIENAYSAFTDGDVLEERRMDFECTEEECTDEECTDNECTDKECTYEECTDEECTDEECTDECCTLHFNPATDPEQLRNDDEEDEDLFMSNINDGDILLEILNGYSTFTD